jgi:2-oxoglutarate ferredoxin oxidoreductase subunit beta
VDIKILLFNNEIYGLTKGQFSPTSRLGTKSKSSPQGSIDSPVRPLSVALAAEATFVSRTMDVDPNHLTGTLQRAAAHKGSAFVEIYQNCKIFNDGVFEYVTDKSSKADNALFLEHGKPMIFGKDRHKGIRLNGLTPEVVTVGKDCGLDDVVVHDETADNATMAYLLSRMMVPQFPEVFGVLRNVTHPTYEELQAKQAAEVTARKGKGDLEKLFRNDDLWVVE